MTVTLENSRIVLTPIDPATARRIIAREEREDDNWHPEYPFADELRPLRGLARSERAETPFTMYAIRLPLTRTAVGGLGFFGPPDESGLVEFGYGLIPAVRGKGLATAAVMLALENAQKWGATRARADTEVENLASRRVLEKAGLCEVGRNGSLVLFETPLG